MEGTFATRRFDPVRSLDMVFLFGRLFVAAAAAAGVGAVLAISGRG